MNPAVTGTLSVQLYSVHGDAAALRAGRYLRRHITEIDDTEGDRFELLATHRRTLLDGGLTAA
ncbi:hypothetical protein [Streptomyces sp. NPDC050759]|uniref:hypothetical protein n=1 Tax=Streptomyces sp. NPDC050759 TaxID=3365635 RepID=UPI00378A358E